MSTVFAKIVRKEIPATIVYEDDEVLAFKDLNPAAPLHLLVIPKRAIENLGAMSEADERLVGRCLRVCARVAREAGLDDYRVVTNNGAGAGQTVFHLHFHVIGGRSLSWPPG